MLAEMAVLPSGIPQGMESRNIVVGPFQAQAQSKKHLLYEALGVSEKVW